MESNALKLHTGRVRLVAAHAGSRPPEFVGTLLELELNTSGPPTRASGRAVVRVDGMTETHQFYLGPDHLWYRRDSVRGPYAIAMLDDSDGHAETAARELAAAVFKETEATIEPTELRKASAGAVMTFRRLMAAPLARRIHDAVIRGDAGDAWDRLDDVDKEPWIDAAMAAIAYQDETNR